MTSRPKSWAPCPRMSIVCALEKSAKGVKVKGAGGLSMTLRSLGREEALTDVGRTLASPLPLILTGAASALATAGSDSGIVTEGRMASRMIICRGEISNPAQKTSEKASTGHTWAGSDVSSSDEGTLRISGESLAMVSIAGHVGFIAAASASMVILRAIWKSSKGELSSSTS